MAAQTLLAAVLLLVVMVAHCRNRNRSGKHRWLMLRTVISCHSTLSNSAKTLECATPVRLLPTSGIGSVKNLIMPSITLGAALMGIVMRLTRSGMLEVMGEDYIRTARAKGIGNWLVITRHALKNTFIPLVTVVGLQLGHLLAGSVIVETVFAWPGVGRVLVTAIGARDYPRGSSRLCLGVHKPIGNDRVICSAAHPANHRLRRAGKVGGTCYARSARKRRLCSAFAVASSTAQPTATNSASKVRWAGL